MFKKCKNVNLKDAGIGNGRILSVNGHAIELQ